MRGADGPARPTLTARFPAIRGAMGAATIAHRHHRPQAVVERLPHPRPLLPRRQGAVERHRPLRHPRPLLAAAAEESLKNSLGPRQTSLPCGEPSSACHPPRHRARPLTSEACPWAAPFLDANTPPTARGEPKLKHAPNLLFEVQNLPQKPLQDKEQMNPLHSALEAWDMSMASVFDKELVVQVKAQIIALLHDGERSMRRTDPNHPYRRFAASGSVTANARRLWRALDEFIEGDSSRSNLAPLVSRMFDDDEAQEAKTHDILRRYREYVNRQTGGGSTSSSDDDSDSD
jgi:hypothetical protein